MAKKISKIATVNWEVLKLAGKTIVFAGRFEKWGSLTQDSLQAQVTTEGGTVADKLAANTDFLVLKEITGASSHEKKVAQLNAKGASIAVLDAGQLHAMLTPTGDEVQAMLQAGPPGHSLLQQRLMRSGFSEYQATRTQRPFVARKVELKGLDLTSVPLWCVDLEDSDLSNTTNNINTQRESYSIGTMTRCKLDGARIDMTVPDLLECSCRGADLSQCWVGFLQDKSRCSSDFTDATLKGMHFTKCNLTGSTFDNADLTHVKLESVVATGVSFRGACLKSVEAKNAKFKGADFANADLSGSELVGANFDGCNLTQAKLCNATLMNASFIGANLDGADLTGANISQADFTGASTAGTIGLSTTPAKKLVIGPKLQELSDLCKQAKAFVTTMEIQASQERLRLRVELGGRIRASFSRDLWADTLSDWSQQAKTVADAMIAVVGMWPSAIPHPETVAATGTKVGLINRKLKQLAMEAWCETYGIDCPDEAGLAQAARDAEADKDKVRGSILADLELADGVERWNARNNLDLQTIKSFPQAKLDGKILDGINFSSLHFENGNFENASLVEADFDFGSYKNSNFRKAKLQFTGKWSHFENCDFTGADLTSANLSSAYLQLAVFSKANMTGANLASAHVQGANLIGAKLNGSSLQGAEFDEATQFPKGFTIPETMVWKGTGLDPRATAAVAAAAAGPIDLTQFMSIMEASVDRERMKKALSMLKAERFQLFAEATSDHLAGIVKSQNDPDLVYSCRLNKDGEFACCTQNLNPCGGLRGALCKHLLVLIIGITQAEEADPSMLNAWIASSRFKKPVLNKDQMSETLLRYKGAEAGEIDWRPTETIPEDFFAL
ncbi:MAG: pentapeptide repeat-containing protein [Planctomycetes bacterium]|nr:pentapeptide repeat-containing protein [Planctomycetota bacterium]